MNTVNNNQERPLSLHRQKGAATLLVTVIIVLLISLLTYTMTRTTVLENRMTASELSSKQAFHAAQAGLDYALQQIILNDLATLNASCAEMLVDAANPDDSPTFQLFFGSEAPECPSAAIGLQTKSFIRSVGRSSDGAAIRVLEVGIDLEREWVGTEVPAPPVPLGPPVIESAIISRGSAALGGTTNAAPCVSVEACMALDRPGNPKPDISDYNQYLVTAGGSITGGDTGVPDSRILDQHKDANRTDLSSMTGDQFFAYLMGSDKDTYKASATVVSAGESLPDVNVNPMVWHEGDLSIQTGSLGSPEKPITLVVNGNLTLVGNVSIWGVVYTTGNDFSAGTSKIFGALLAENDITTATGNSSVFYNDSLAAPYVGGGTTGEVASVLGDVDATFDANSWREIFLGT
jgi:Tfp pilus assembly protein PilX